MGKIHIYSLEYIKQCKFHAFRHIPTLNQLPLGTLASLNIILTMIIKYPRSPSYAIIKYHLPVTRHQRHNLRKQVKLDVIFSTIIVTVTPCTQLKAITVIFALPHGKNRTGTRS